MPPHVDCELTGSVQQATASVVALVAWIEGAQPAAMVGQVGAAADPGSWKPFVRQLDVGQADEAAFAVRLASDRSSDLH
jgi:hypothetical protein